MEAFFPLSTKASQAKNLILATNRYVRNWVFEFGVSFGIAAFHEKPMLTARGQDATFKFGLSKWEKAVNLLLWEDAISRDYPDEFHWLYF